MKKFVYLVLFALLIFYGWKYYSENYSKQVIKSFEVKDVTIELTEREFLRGKMKMYVPSGLEKVTKSQAQNKEILKMKPDEVYQIKNTPIQVSIQHTDQMITDYGIKDYKQELDISLPQSGDIDKILGNGIKVINIKNVAFYEIATSRNNLYNYICLTELQGRLVIIQFMFPLDNMKEWRPVAKSMMNSIRTN